MRAVVKKDHEQYRKGQIVKGATAKVLVADGAAEEMAEGRPDGGGLKMGIKTHAAKIGK